MALDISVSRALGLLAGVLILLVGIFVLKAKPHSTIHRLFCAFAVADGVSTFAYSLSLIPTTTGVQLHARLVYFHTLIAFLSLLILFGLSFPRPLLPPRWRLPAYIGVGVCGGALIAWHALDPHAFWVGQPGTGGVTFLRRPVGRFVTAAVVATYAALALRLVHLLRREPSPTHRSQAAFVLGGMALGYTPYATTTFVEILQRGADTTIAGPDLSVASIYAASALAVVALIYAALVILRDVHPDRARERSFLLKCFLGVLLLTLPSLLFPGRVVSDFLQQAGLVAWPIILGYAIARYEILDIGPTVRRTATISLATTILAVLFFVAEAVLENALQARFAGALGAPLVAVLIAGLLTALVFAPISALARRFAGRLAPDLAADAMRARQIEIYRHGLEAALADGEISATENRILASMRTTLGISNDDHSQLLLELRGRYAGAA